MPRSIFGYILKFSLRQQIVVLCLTLAAMPFFYASLDLPKRIINQAIDAPADRFPYAITVVGRELARVSQTEFLVLLCLAFLFFVLCNGAFKYVINVYKGLMGERMLRRLRFQLYERMLRFPMSRFRRISQGETVAVVASEVELLGGFIGDAYALPLYQGGLLLTAFAFIVVQDPLMGLAVIALYPVQIVLIPRLQYQVNQLGKQRVREVRALSNRITESMAHVREIRVHDTARFELAGFAEALGRIFEIRYRIYRKKFFIKFLNNFLAQITPFFFFLIGGWLVIAGELSLGALVAILAAYKDLGPPWKELLGYYQDLQDARIRYEQVIAQFDVPGLEPADGADEDGAITDWPAGALATVGVTLEEDGAAPLLGIDLVIAPDEHVALLGAADSGKDSLAMVLAGLVAPSQGTVRIGEHDLERLAASLTGRAIAHVDASPGLVTGTVFDNLVYGLKHDPAPAPEHGAERARRAEALAAGNPPDDPHADWIDYQAADAASAGELLARVLDALDAVELRAPLVTFGLRARIDPDRDAELAAAVLDLRRRLAGRLAVEPLCLEVAPFDQAQFNDSLTVAENLLFGAPVGEALELGRLARNRYLRRVLKGADLDDALLSLGLDIARTAGALSAEGASPRLIAESRLPVDEDEIPRLKIIAGLALRRGVRDVPRRDRALLLTIALRLIAGRHVDVALDAGLRAKIVAARRAFRHGLPEALGNAVRFFEPDHFNPALTVRENMIFGEIRDHRPGAAEAVNRAIAEEIDAAGIRALLERAGLGFDVGIEGRNLTAVERSKLGLARAVLKRPRLLIVNGATAGFDSATEARVIGNLRDACAGRCLIVTPVDPGLAAIFDRTVELAAGRVRADRAAEAPRAAAGPAGE